MRRTALLLATLSLLGSGLLPAPAGAEDYWQTVRAIDDRFEVVGTTCTGDAADPPVVRVGASDIHYRGVGSASVTTASDALGGVLVRDPHPLHGVYYHVWATTGDAPQAQWRVEANGDTLVSDPLPLRRDRWVSVALHGTTLHGPDGWSGTIEDYIAQFGKGDHWTAGLLTGSCLDSTQVRLDGIGTRRALYDFEPRTWVTVRVGEAGPPYDGDLDAGERFVVRGVAHRWDVRTDSEVAVRGADVVLQRRWTGTPQWRTVTHDGTWHDSADRSADWRAVWRRPAGRLLSPAEHQNSLAHASEARVDEKRCRPDPDVLPVPPTCRTIRVDAGTVRFTGTAHPPWSARATVVAHRDDYDGAVVDRGRAVVGRDGTWQVPIRTQGHDHLYVEVDVEPASPRHELRGGGPMRFPLAVR